LIVARSSRLSRLTEDTRSTRRRRSEPKERKPLKKKARRSYMSEDRSMPPVMVRGDFTWLPQSARKRNKTRRRYDVALNIPGAEMRLPALPQVSFGWRLLSALMVASLLGLLYHLWNSPTYRIRQVEMVGLQRLTSSDVNALLNLQGEPIFTLDVDALQHRLENTFPEFSSVSVEVGLPNRIILTVEERLPLLAWRQDGRTILVDSNGVSFPMRNPDEPPPSLVIEASSSPPSEAGLPLAGAPTRFMPVEMVSAILTMKAQAPANTPLIYDGKHGLGWKDAQGWEVYFGDVRNMEMKLRVYKALVKHLQQDDITPALVSVEYVNAPYYRLEK
jgi:cell division protein FtsQ